MSILKLVSDSAENSLSSHFLFEAEGGLIATIF
jgi:hypothetical protein